MLRRALSFSLPILALALPCAAQSAPTRLPELARSIDDELVQMGRKIPGFGGMFYDEQGYPTVYLREPGSAAAQFAVKSLGEEVRVLRGDFEFEQLIEWKQALRPVLALPGVVFLDADEARNRVVIGIDALQGKSFDRGRLDKALATRGVPAKAVLYQESQPFRELIGYTDGDKAQATTNILKTLRPVPGGVQLTYPNPPLTFFCTIGFNAYLGGAFGFVTNSHCSIERGVVDDGRYAQGTAGSATIATEIADPPYFTDPPCPTGRKCRYSDSSFVRYDADSTKLGSFRKIARTAARDPQQGSVALKPASARFTLSGVGAPPLVGQVVNKVGRSTGWTYGKVVSSCVDVNSFLTSYTLFCQHLVLGGSAAGDSGSPVFSWTRGTTVNLLGILWAGGTDNQGNTLFAFCPVANIEQELGTLRVK